MSRGRGRLVRIAHRGEHRPLYRAQQRAPHRGGDYCSRALCPSLTLLLLFVKRLILSLSLSLSLSLLLSLTLRVSQN